MKFSIVTSFYNESEELINEVCKSILSQTYTNFEWVITDDFSQSGTRDIIKSLPKRDKRIRYVEQIKKKEVWWNPQTYAIGDVVVTVDGDDHMFPKSLEVLNYFYNKYPDVISISTEIRNYNENKHYIGSLYLNHQNYDNIINYVLNIKHDSSIPTHGKNELFDMGYNRSWRNINGLDFRKNLDERLIIVDFLQFADLEEIGKILHIPRALYGYNTRNDSISRKIDIFNSHNLRTEEINQSILDRRKGKDIRSIKRTFDQIFIESNAFLDCGINFDTIAKKLSLITPNILSPSKEEQIRELYFDHDIYFNEYRDDIDYCVVQLNSPDQYDSFLQIYENIHKYIGKIETMIQITYKDISREDNDLYNKLLEFFKERHIYAWFDFNNQYITIKIY